MAVYGLQGLKLFLNSSEHARGMHQDCARREGGWRVETQRPLQALFSMGFFGFALAMAKGTWPTPSWGKCGNTGLVGVEGFTKNPCALSQPYTLREYPGSSVGAEIPG